MRAISAERSGIRRGPAAVARAFMGHCERRIENPECISAHAARATARASRARRPAAARELAGVFADRQRIPHQQRAMPQDRHAPGGAGGGDVARELRRVERDHALGELEAEMLHQHPRAQRPRRVVLVAHGEQHFVQDGSPGNMRAMPQARSARSASTSTTRSGKSSRC